MAVEQMSPTHHEPLKPPLTEAASSTVPVPLQSGLSVLKYGGMESCPIRVA
jgi:hypothetical protein